MSVDRETNSFPRTRSVHGDGKPRREAGFIPAPLDSRHYSESASGTAARERCYIVLRAVVKAESRTRKDDEGEEEGEEEEEEKEVGETVTFHHTFASRSFFLFSLLPFLDRTRRRYAKVKDLPISEPVSIRRKLVRPETNVRADGGQTRASQTLADRRICSAR